MHLFEGQHYRQGKDGERNVHSRVGKGGERHSVGEQHFGYHAQHRGTDETHHRRLEAGHTAFYDAALLVFFIKAGHDEDHDKGGQYHAQRSAGGAQHRGKHRFAPHLTTHVGGHIDGKGAGGGLGHGDEVDQIRLGDPAVAQHLLLDEGEHSVAATKGE